MDGKQDSAITCPKDTYRLKVKGQEEIFHANVNQNIGGVTILILVDLQLKTVTTDKRDHDIKIKSQFIKKMHKL